MESAISLENIRNVLITCYIDCCFVHILLRHTEELVFPGRSFDGSIPAFIGQLSKLSEYLA